MSNQNQHTEQDTEHVPSERQGYTMTKRKALALASGVRAWVPLAPLRTFDALFKGKVVKPKNDNLMCPSCCQAQFTPTKTNQHVHEGWHCLHCGLFVDAVSEDMAEDKEHLKEHIKQFGREYYLEGQGANYHRTDYEGIDRNYKLSKISLLFSGLTFLLVLNNVMDAYWVMGAVCMLISMLFFGYSVRYAFLGYARANALAYLDLDEEGRMWLAENLLTYYINRHKAPVQIEQSKNRSDQDET